MILGVSARTANEVVLGDLGWWELKARRDKARVKFLKKLVDSQEGEHTRTLIEDKLGMWKPYTINQLISR